MLFVIIGVLIIAMNLAGIGPFANWTWEISGDLWKFCLPFLLALLWWIWADKTGMNKRREMAKMEEKKENRRRSNLERMGLNFRSHDKDMRKEVAFKSARQREIDKIEGKRTKHRQKLRDSILQSRFDSETPGDSTYRADDAKR